MEIDGDEFRGPFSGCAFTSLLNGTTAPGKFRLMHNNASNRYLRAHSRPFVIRLHLSDNLVLIHILLNCEDTIGSGDGSNIVADGPYGDAIASARGRRTT